MDYKLHWQGWSKQWMSAEHAAAIMKAGSYAGLNAILREEARRECENGKPFYLGVTSWSPGHVVPAHSHCDYMLEGQMRATRIHTTYFAYEKMAAKGHRLAEKVTDPVLVQIVTTLNGVGDEAWPFTLALAPAALRSDAWATHPVYKRIAEAFAGSVSMSVYLDNLEVIQKAYA